MASGDIDVVIVPTLSGDKGLPDGSGTDVPLAGDQTKFSQYLTDYVKDPTATGHVGANKGFTSDIVQILEMGPRLVVVFKRTS